MWLGRAVGEADRPKSSGRGTITRWRACFGFLRTLPDFVIIGAQKGGTTSLYAYLRQHPGYRRPKKKEIDFFDQWYDRGVGWYRAHFPLRIARPVAALLRGRPFLTGEGSVSYMIDPRVPSRVRRLIPGVKLIALLRNPVDRAYSHYHHEFRAGRERLSFEDAIRAEPERIAGELERLARDERYTSYSYLHFTYLTRGRYAEQLERWFALFPRDQILIVKSETFYSDPAGELTRIGQFLGLDPADPRAYISSFDRRNAGRYEPMAPATRARLTEYFAPHNERLCQLLGTDFGWDR